VVVGMDALIATPLVLRSRGGCATTDKLERRRQMATRAPAMRLPPKSADMQTYEGVAR
jgi:hypothetical protein